MAWVILVVAGLLEATWTTCMKYSHGFTKPGFSALAILLSIASFVMLGYAMKNIPLGTAYVMWTGIGTAGTVTMGIVLFQESASPIRLLFIALIFTGLIGLKVTGQQSDPSRSGEVEVSVE